MKKQISDFRREYHFSSLSENTMATDPIIQFNVWLREALKAKIEEPNSIVLSTSDHNGNVSGRVVLLKGIEKGGFVFFTNYDSRKGVQIESNPKAALTFHWQTMERQIRIEGIVKKITRKESVAYFKSRPVDSQISSNISPQSSVIPDRAFLESMRDGFLLDLQGSSPQCPENWGGYRLKPIRVEFWQGRPHRLHDRIQYRKIAQKWILERLAP